jgi:hypothetical protein
MHWAADGLLHLHAVFSYVLLHFAGWGSEGTWLMVRGLLRQA